MGLAVRLRIGDEATAELAAIPESDALRTAGEAITRMLRESNSEAGASFKAKIERMAEHYLDGSQPDFAKASVVEAIGVLRMHRESNSEAGASFKAKIESLVGDDQLSR